MGEVRLTVKRVAKIIARFDYKVKNLKRENIILNRGGKIVISRDKIWVCDIKKGERSYRLAGVTARDLLEEFWKILIKEGEL